MEAETIGLPDRTTQELTGIDMEVVDPIGKGMTGRIHSTRTGPDTTINC